MNNQDYINLVKQFREHFHRFPELSNFETNTADFIKKVLEENGIEYIDNIGGFGILAVVRGNGSSSTIAIRADMDALPIQELNNVSYRSTIEGAMHACGHDLHMAVLLSILVYFKNNPSILKGTLLGVFQPAEEKPPGGAQAMLNDNLFRDHKPDYILALHTAPDLAVGTIGLREDFSWAAADEIEIIVNGKGGHGALTHEVNDPILAAAHLITATEQINSRLQKAGEVSVLSFGQICGGTKSNIIPDQVIIAGTFRSFNEAWQSRVHQKLNEICKGVAQLYQVSIDLKINKGYPPLFNNPELTRRVKEFAQVFLGSDNVIDDSYIMTSEDFSFFSQKYPSCMIRLGTSINDGRYTNALHSDIFEINEAVYEVVFPLMVGIVNNISKY